MEKSNSKKRKCQFTAISMILVLIAIFDFNITIQAQVTIGSGRVPHKDALLDLKEDTDDALSKKGLLLPRVELKALDDPSPLSEPVKGMIVYNIKSDGTGDNAVTSGFYYNDGNQWVRIGNLTDKINIFNDLWQATSDWQIMSQELSSYGKVVNFMIKLKYTKTGEGMNIWNSAHNSNKIAEISTSEYKNRYKPYASTTITSNDDININCQVNFPARTISTTAECEIDFDGNLYIRNVRESVGTFLNKGTIKENDIIVVSGAYFIN